MTDRQKKIDDLKAELEALYKAADEGGGGCWWCCGGGDDWHDEIEAKAKALGVELSEL